MFLVSKLISQKNVKHNFILELKSFYYLKSTYKTSKSETKHPLSILLGVEIKL